VADLIKMKNKHMNICIIGSGGREAALAWKIGKSPLCKQLYIVPGNGGTAAYGENVNLDISDRSELANWLREKTIDMLVVGPEAPLVDGLYDDLAGRNDLKDLMIVGPSREGAMLEGSKSFAKAFMTEFNIPTAAYASFNQDQTELAVAYLEQLKPPYVLKADGLAAGKGVLILENKDETVSEIRNMLSGKFGTASKTLVIEEFLDGIEFSVFVLTDGISYQLLPVAKDYKRRGEGDTGLNTGGMGAVSPVPFVDDPLMEKVRTRIIEPTMEGIRSRNMKYKGFIFFGLIRVGNEPFVIEYNCRLGDPETEAIIPRIKNDLVEMLLALFKGDLTEKKVIQDTRTAATIMLVSEGYPGDYEKGKQITGIDEVSASMVFHAGTRLENGTLLTHGGRVLAVTSLDDSLPEALAKSMSSIEKIRFDGMRFRRDIGFDL
jgi:phosphoribosylamine--glycine ligase